MSVISAIRITLLGVLALSARPAHGQETLWPLGRQVDLSSGFGDFREGRFHAGVDIRTGGRVGRLIFSPVDGYVWRVKMAYDGYGKGLYVMGDDGYIYVFGHLSRLGEEIDRAVKQAQVAAGRYYVDIYFPGDSIRVKSRQVIGRAGQSGTASGPHLHFEKRDAGNRPINPLTHGYLLEDTIHPVFSQVCFELTDERSLFADGSRRSFVNVDKEKPGSYTVDWAPYLNRPFGLLVDCYDRTRWEGMRQAVRRLTLFLDGRLLYESVFDTVDFEAGKSVGLEYDYWLAVNGREGVRRLYHKEGNEFAGSRAPDMLGGIVGHQGGLDVGPHTVRIVAEDCSGNVSELKFDFLWGPPGDLYRLDSTVEVEKARTDYYFSPTGDYEALAIDSFHVLVNAGDRWGRASNARAVKTEDGSVRAEIEAEYIGSSLLRLAAQSRHGCEMRDEPFNGIREGRGKWGTIMYDVVEDGLRVKVGSNSKFGTEARLDFYYQDRLLGREVPSRFFTKAEYFFFVPPRPEYARVDRIDLAWSTDTTVRPLFSQDVFLAAVGFEDEDTVTVDSLFTVMIGRDNLFTPRFIGIRKDASHALSRYGIHSDVYRILPDAFVTREDFDVSLRMTRMIHRSQFAGLCWLDEEEGRFVWLEDSKSEDNILSATSLGGGVFASVLDADPPRVEHLSLVAGRTVDTPYPEIEFRLIDTLSGIADDQSIDIRIDRKWMIPEYDPETEICKTQPVDPLEPGEHHLAIIATDRAGNKTEDYLIFKVSDRGEESGNSR